MLSKEPTSILAPLQNEFTANPLKHHQRKQADPLRLARVVSRLNRDEQNPPRSERRDFASDSEVAHEFQLSWEM